MRDDNAITDIKEESPGKTAFADLASTLLRALQADTRWAYRLAGVLRRSERESIWPALTPFPSIPRPGSPAWSDRRARRSTKTKPSADKEEIQKWATRAPSVRAERDLAPLRPERGPAYLYGQLPAPG